MTSVHISAIVIPYPIRQLEKNDNRSHNCSGNRSNSTNRRCTWALRA